MGGLHGGWGFLRKIVFGGGSFFEMKIKNAAVCGGNSTALEERLLLVVVGGIVGAVRLEVRDV